MSRPIGKRYVAHSPIAPLPGGVLYNGEDLALKREVFLYISEGTDLSGGEESIRGISKASSFFHDRFQHILDSAIEEGSLVVVLRHRTGKPLIQDLRQRIWSLPRVIDLVTDLGMSMLQAMEEQITGYSVAADNLWLSEDGRLSVINHWEVGDPHTQGAMGLCGLMVQLFSGSAAFPGSFATLDSQLSGLPILLATTDQKTALIDTVSRVTHGKGSLSSLIFDLRGLQQTSSAAANETASPASHLEETPAVVPTHAAVPIPTNRSKPRTQPEVQREDVQPAAEDEEEEKTPLIYRNSFLIVSSLFIIAVLAWFFWPSSNADPNPHMNMTETNAPKSTANTIPKQTQQTSKPAPSSAPQASPATEPAQNQAVPGLVGMAQPDAEKQAVAAGFRYEFLLEPDAQPKGIVYKQEPAAGTAAAKGSTITFWVSKGSP